MQDVGKMQPDQFQIVQYGQNGSAFGVKLFDNLQERLRGLAIDASKRLIQQNNGSLCQQQSREEHAL